MQLYCTYRWRVMGCIFYEGHAEREKAGEGKKPQGARRRYCSQLSKGSWDIFNCPSNRLFPKSAISPFLHISVSSICTQLYPLLVSLVRTLFIDFPTLTHTQTQTRCYNNKEYKLRDLYPILRISASDPRAHFMPDKVVPKFPIVIIAIFLDPWLLRKIPRICSVISTLVGAVKVGVILGAGMPERECLATRFPLKEIEINLNKNTGSD